MRISWGVATLALFTFANAEYHQFTVEVEGNTRLEPPTTIEPDSGDAGRTSETPAALWKRDAAPVIVTVGDVAITMPNLVPAGTVVISTAEPQSTAKSHINANKEAAPALVTVGGVAISYPNLVPAGTVKIARDASAQPPVTAPVITARAPAEPEATAAYTRPEKLSHWTETLATQVRGLRQ